MSKCNYEGSDISILDEMKSLCEKQLDFLTKQLDDGHFSGRSFYGEMFTALAMAEYNYNDYNIVISEILNWYINAPKTASNFHWEFNNYALLKLGDKHKELKKYIESPLIYRGTDCSNWSLLRVVGKLMEGRKLDTENPQEIIKKMQLPNGLMLDENHVASFQYHCFMMALIYDIYKLTGTDFFLEAFLKGVEFISNFTLKNGDTLYVGRGQEQIFGYGTLLYIYSVSYSLTNDGKYYILLERVWEFIKCHWSEERMLPLVLNDYETDSELTLDLRDRRHLGWYSYNNFYDYLPFFTYYLVSSLDNLSNWELPKNRTQDILKNYCDDNFLHYSTGFWDIGMSCYKGASANALPFPFIVYKGREITSVCGGDDYTEIGYYQLASIPLPSGRYANSYLHILDSEKYLKNKIRSIIRKKREYADSYLWELGEHKLYMDEGNNEFGLRSTFIDFDFVRSIKCKKEKLIIRDYIKFNRNVNYKLFIPLRLLFRSIGEPENGNCYPFSGGRLIFQEETKAVVRHKEFMTAKTEVDSIQVCLCNYKAGKNEEITFEYIIEADE